MTEEEQREICILLSVGCDRETACHYVGRTVDELRTALRHSDSLGARARRAEATAEFAHMRNVHQAAKEDKHWRASVWWLEQRAPGRYGGRRPASVSHDELANFIDSLAQAIRTEVKAGPDRQRLLEQLDEIGAKIHLPDVQLAVHRDSPTAPPTPLPVQHYDLADRRSADLTGND